MVNKCRSSGEPQSEMAPREIVTSAAALKPDERELDAVNFMRTTSEGGLQTETVASPVEGWVIGVPVVDGDADSAWLELGDTRVRIKVHVEPNDRQLEWVKGQLFS